MKLISYIHPIRTYLPCTGAGRFINNILLGLSTCCGVETELLFSNQWLGNDGNLDLACPLRNLPKHTFPMPENSTERKWKFWSRPKMDGYLPDDTNWLFAPMETYIPVSKCPVAITIYDVQAVEPDLPWSHTWQHRWFGYKWRTWLGKALRDYQIIFTISEFSKQRMVKLLGADPSKIVVVGAGVEQAFFDIASANPACIERPTKYPYTLIIGGLRYKKGADYVLAVAKQLLKEKNSLHIVVAGDSEESYRQVAHNYPNVLLLGTVSDEKLPGLVRNASSLLFLSHYEGFGIPAIEAMAAGIPAVVANRASLPEVIGDAGIVVEPENTGEVVGTLLNLERNTGLRDEYSRRGQKHATQYTWSQCVERILTAFEKFS